MDASDEEMDDNSEKTRPPASALRYGAPSELYAGMPQVRELTQLRPREDEGFLEFVERLGATQTPEEVITLTAFALHPKMAIWWGYECLRMLADRLPEGDHELLQLVADWTSYPDAENRYRAMKVALWAPNTTPAVHLALAVGWSGGQFAPNDPALMPPWRAPRAVNSAVLSCLAKADLDQRPLYLARFTDLAVSILRT